MEIDAPGADGILEPGAALERLSMWQGRIDSLAAATATMSERLRRTRVTLSDDEGLVEVTLDSSGALIDLRLSPRIHTESTDAVAAAIVDTANRAKARLADLSQEIIAETMGTDSTAVRTLAARVNQQLRDSGAGR